MNLLQFQRRMAEDVTRPLTLDFGMQVKTEDGRSLCEHAAAYIKPNDRLSSFERLEIYNRQYWFRAVAAVAEDYPALHAVFGEKHFDRLVRAYLQENPSTSFTLRNLGARLPQWLREHPEISRRRHALALDVARLEWAYVEAFDGASYRPLSILDMQGLVGDSTLTLQPHLQLLDVQHPVDEWVLAVRQGGAQVTRDNSLVREQRQSLRRSRRPFYLAIHRCDDSVYYRRITREAFLLLTGLKKGRSLASAIESAFAGSGLSDAKQAARIGEYFAHASAQGWFCVNESEVVDRGLRATYSCGRRASLR